MPTIDVDFESFKEITARRTTESMTEGDVVRAALGLGNAPAASSGGAHTGGHWLSEGVQFPIGLQLKHWFRDGRIVEAKIVSDGINVNGKVFGGLSPAGVEVAGYQLNGWRFWHVKNKRGKWVTADSLRG
jgi:hypothetical protein